MLTTSYTRPSKYAPTLVTDELLGASILAMEQRDTASEYLRVSKDKSGRLRSCEEQHDENMRAALENGWGLGRSYEEEAAVSASRYGRKSRPGFAALVADLEAGRFTASVLILWESSRGSRRLSEWARFLELLEERGVRMHVTSHGRTYDLSLWRDRRTLQEDGTDNEAESAKRSHQIKRATNANAKAGRPNGGQPPYGYRHELDPATRLLRLVPDEEQAAVVREIFDRLAEGHTQRSVAMALNKRGLTGSLGAPWTAEAVHRTAMKFAYVGLRVHKGQTYPAQWEPLVRPARFYGVRAILSNPARRTSRAGNVKHLLSMIATCGPCGGPLTVARHRVAEDGVTCYRCRNRGCVAIRQDELDAWVSLLATKRLSQPDAFAAFTADDEPAVREAEDELAELRRRHEEMAAAMAHGKMSVTAFTAAEPELLRLIGRAEKRLASIQVPGSVLTLLEAAATVEEAWKAAEIRCKRDVVRELFREVRVEQVPVRGLPAAVSERVTISWQEQS